MSAPRFLTHTLHGFLVSQLRGTGLAMVCMPGLKQICTEILDTKASRLRTTRTLFDRNRKSVNDGMLDPLMHQLSMANRYLVLMILRESHF